MKFYGKETEYLLGLSLDELKLLHKTLWKDLKARKAIGLDEEASDLLYELQMILMKEAQRLGVDPAVHSEWAEFAGLEQNCSLEDR